MAKVLIAYTTNSGSTAEIAQAIGEELEKCGAQADVRPLEDVQTIAGYDAVVLGAPMILGWHASARRFLKQHRQALSQVKVAMFASAMMLTNTGEHSVRDVPVVMDPALAQLPQKPGRLSFKERYATVSNYSRPMLKYAPHVRPVSVAFFGGKLEMFRLKLLQMLFVMVIIRAQPGDLRDWDFIRGWAASLASQFELR